MKLSTIVPIQKSIHPIDYHSKIVLLGSCFAENIGEKFEYFKFQNWVNPFGIIFNPVSIEKLIEKIVLQIPFTEKDIFYHNELWHCYEVHSDLSHQDKEKCIQNLNAILQSTYNQLSNATHIVITLGTSWVYKHIETDTIVANCHKVPQNQFTKELLSIHEIEKSIENTIALIQSINPDCKFVFTVSPVRHIKDGFVENQWSKSHLIAALHQILKSKICNLHPRPKVEQAKQSAIYFPSYEIMMDELRDYRFYKEDMLHPSQVAIDYIWIKFFENYIDEKEFATMNQVCEIQRALKHRPFHPESESHQQFLSKLQDKIDEIQQQHPHIPFC